MLRKCLSILLGLIITASVAPFIHSPVIACGVERWSVKTGTDADAGLINLGTTKQTTIANLRSLAAPNPIPSNNRVQPTETTVWVINATLTEFKAETDEDYHLVIKDSGGLTMICEIPATHCVGSGSPLLSGITNARNEFNAKFTATSSFQTANIPVQVTGVGMFDFLHGQTGVAPNGIELHPLLDIRFNPSASDFSVTDSPAALSIAQGSSATSTITTTTSGSFNSSISFSVSGLPTGATASFSPSSIAAPGSGSTTMTVTAGASTPAGSSTVTVTATGGGVTHTTTLGLTVTSSATPDFTIGASPSSVSVVQGTSSNSTISSTISGGFSSALSLSASGLPSGVTASFSPASIAAPGSGSSILTLSAGSSATVGSSTVTVTASGGGKTHTASIALNVTSSGGGVQQLLGNPGFENGSSNPSPWSATSGVINNSSTEPPHSGSWDAWLDGYGTTHTDTLQQTVSIPSATSSAVLSFWLHIDTAETSTTRAFDSLQVQVRDSSGQTVLTTLATFTNLDHNTGYRQVSFDLSSFKGQTITIYLLGQEDSELQTSFVVDDFTLNIQ